LAVDIQCLLHQKIGRKYMANNKLFYGVVFDKDKANQITRDIQLWIGKKRAECGLIYVKKNGEQGQPYNFVVDRDSSYATSGDWSIHLKKPSPTVYMLYHLQKNGIGNIWTGRHVKTVEVGSRYKVELDDLHGPIPVTMSFRELTGVKEPQKGIRYARRTLLEEMSIDSLSAENSQIGLADSETLGIIKRRRGQDVFRKKLLLAWNWQCAVTECLIVDLLEAAHIEPHRDGHNYQTCNGLLLRADIHTLFDLGLISIDENMQVHVDSKLAKSEYADLEGKFINKLPGRIEDRPVPEALKKHYKIFSEKQTRLRS
jgi:hypothetical protein